MSSTTFPQQLHAKTCANCKIFGWKQPDLGTSPLKQPDMGTRPLKRCTGCRMLFYCSKECQAEHWRKVHKDHCRFLSGRRPLASKGHNKEDCKHCIMEEAAGEAVFKEGNPNYICFFNMIKNPKAKGLKEMQPLRAGNRLERIVDLLQRLLLKIQKTRHPISRLHPVQVALIADELWQVRARMFANTLVYPSNCYVHPDLSKLDNLILPTFLKDHPSSGRLQLWKTFTGLLAMLFGVGLVELDGLIKRPEKSLPKHQATTSKMVRVGSYLKVVDRILEAFEDRVVSQKDFAYIICEGNLQRACSGCKKKVTIDNVSTFLGWNKGKPAVLWHLGQDHVFSCGSNVCDKLMIPQPGSVTDNWHIAVHMTVNKLKETRCDFCFLLAPLKEVNRFWPILFEPL